MTKIRCAAHATLFAILIIAATSRCASVPPGPESEKTIGSVVPGLVSVYLDEYFEMFPSRATEAGRHDLDGRLEDLSPERIAAWIALNRATARELESAMSTALPASDALDAELLLAQAKLEVHRLVTLDVSRRNPLFWSGIVANANVFLLVRDDLPESDRLDHAVERAAAIPRLCRQAEGALAATDPSRIAPELAHLAAGQTRSIATFYRRGFPAIDPSRGDLEVTGASAAAAIEHFASFLDDLAERATGSPILGDDYAETFRLGTGVKTPVDRVLERAEAALEAKRAETAEYGRSVWSRVFPTQPAPGDDRVLIRALFDRISSDHARDTHEFLEETLPLVDEIGRFVREHDVITLPDRGRLEVGVSPSYFIGQSVGGVYPAGPYGPDEATYLFLPAPSPDAPPERQNAFFRDFNAHFMRMIIPHETIPGHTLQLRMAALQSHPVRALFPDPVYVEGWGTFCERLMLDEGWGGPLDRLAHLKKQLENLARTIVDIRVNAKGMSREEMMRFLRDDALQDEQFASNMWVRTITSSPQITTYWLGYEEVSSLYRDVRAARGDDFALREFMDGMMEMGPVAVRHYRERMLGAGSGGRL